MFLGRSFSSIFNRMKKYCLAALLVPSTILCAAEGQKNPPPPLNYAIAQRSANENVWAETITDQFGQEVTRSFAEVATGLNFWDEGAGQWKESREEIESFPSGAVARQGQHKVIFANNLATVGAIYMQMPDGQQRLQSHILGLGYQDKMSGSNVLIAELKSSVPGVIVPPNQVLYGDAFDSLKADVLYTYTKNGFEQFVILREKPPLPELFGLSSGSSVLQVLPEFDSAPPPRIRNVSVGVNALPDQILDFQT